MGKLLQRTPKATVNSLKKVGEGKKNWRNSSHTLLKVGPMPQCDLGALNEARHRAEQAEGSLAILESQLQSSSQTIMKLSDEVDSSTSRLNEQADMIATLQGQGTAASASVPAEHFEEIQYRSHPEQENSITPPTMPFEFQTPQTEPQQPWGLPGSAVEQSVAEEPDNVDSPPPPRKKVGFWGWVAGADLAAE